MELFAEMIREGHEQVTLWSDPAVGYRGIIAVHDTTLGPGLGGTRYWRYASEEEALLDALRLSRAMTYKAAMAGLDAGGGKAVVLRPKGGEDRESIFRAHGRAIEALGGRYCAAEDVGTTVADMDTIRTETRHVSGTGEGVGDPSPLTALGTFEGMRACAEVRWGDPSLEGRHVAVQGVGQVGYQLCALLAGAGARLTVADLVPQRAARAQVEFGASVLPPETILSIDADLLSPCAMGGAIDERSFPMLRVEVIAGAANNQLAEPHLAEALEGRGILYAPDYVINAGGLIGVYGELRGWSLEECRRRAVGIRETVAAVLRQAGEEGVPPPAAADRMAEARIAEARRAKAAGSGR